MKGCRTSLWLQYFPKYTSKLCRIGLFVFVLVCNIIQLQAQAEYMCHGVLNDSGGVTGTYGNNEYQSKTFCSDNNKQLKLTFTVFDVEEHFDYLYIYDGQDENAPLIGAYTNGKEPQAVLSTSGCLTVVFRSDATGVRKGYSAFLSCAESCDLLVDTIQVSPATCGLQNGEIHVKTEGSGGLVYYSIDGGINYQGYPIFTGLAGGNYDIYIRYADGTCPSYAGYVRLPSGCVEICNNGIDDDNDGQIDYADYDCLNTVYTCDTKYTDDGGAFGNYSNNLNEVKTFCSPTNTQIRAIFNSFELNTQNTVHSFADTLYVYNGPSTQSKLIGAYYGNNLVHAAMRPPALIQSTETCLTFKFVSGAEHNSKGWEADISCTQAVQHGIEICGNGKDDDFDGLIDEEDSDCSYLQETNTCDTRFRYFVPPTWALNNPSQAYLPTRKLILSSASQQAEVKLFTMDGSYQSELVLEDGNLTSIDFDATTAVLHSDSLNTAQSNRALIIESDVPLAVDFLNTSQKMSAMFRVRGREAAGLAFRLGMQTNSTLALADQLDRKELHYASILAIEDNTQVFIHGNTELLGGAKDREISLQAGESYMIASANPMISLTGSLVRADKKIIVLAGSATSSAQGKVKGDASMDILTPIVDLSREYLVTSTNTAQADAYALVVAVENNTLVFQDNKRMAHINAGEFVRLNLKDVSVSYIRSTKPASVYQYTGIQEFGVGMTQVPPIGQFRGDHKLLLNTVYGAQSELIVQIESQGVQTLKLNGVQVNQLEQVRVEQVAQKSQYAIIRIPGVHLLEQNTIEAASIFHAAWSFYRNSESAAMTYLSSFNEKVNALDPITDFRTSYYSLDTIGTDSLIQHQIKTLANGSFNKIKSVTSNGLGEVELNGDLSFSYRSGSQAGSELLTFTLGNQYGIETSLCLAMQIDTIALRYKASDILVCAGDLVTIEAQSLGGTAPHTFLWSTGETTENIQVQPSEQTSYSVLVRDAKGLSGRTQVDIKIREAEQASAGEDLIICAGSSVDLNAFAPQGGTGYWSPSSGVFEQSNKAKTSYTPAVTEKDTSYLLTWNYTGSFDTVCYAGSDQLNLTITPFIEVQANPSVSICALAHLELDSLHPRINTDVAGVQGLWYTQGDGYFMPGGAKSADMQAGVRYVPGATEKNQGHAKLFLTANQGNQTVSCSFGTAEVAVQLQSAPNMVCNDHLNITLQTDCSVNLNLDMFLEKIEGPAEFYDLKFYDAADQEIAHADLNGTYAGQTLKYEIEYLCGGAICSGTFSLKDQHIPNLNTVDWTTTCLEQTAPEASNMPLPATAIIIPNGQDFIIEQFDACGPATLQYQDSIVAQECSTPYSNIIYRQYNLTDAVGNTTSSTQRIFIERVGMDAISMPKNYDNLTHPALSCDADFPLNSNGYPDPSFTGEPQLNQCGYFQYTYKDHKIQVTSASYTILREWVILDACTSVSNKYTQTIKIMDTLAPIIQCPVDKTVSTDNYSCSSGLILLEAPVIQDNCESFEYKVEAFDVDGKSLDVSQQASLNYISNLALGDTKIVYTATDESGNSSSCSYTIRTEDQTPPNPICDGHTKVALNNDGATRLYATALDDGSYDNCGIQELRIAKMTDSCGGQANVFGKYVEFCCAEIGQKVQVQLQVVDVHGNMNACMAEVVLEDKIAPAILAPADLTIACTTVWNLDDLSNFGTIATDPSEQKDVQIFDAYNNGVVAKDGIALDNCSVTWTETNEANINCGVGVITRTFTATDKYGQTAVDVQTIHVQNANPFNGNDITWPENIDIEGCSTIDIDPELTGKPSFSNKSCASILLKHEDKIFTTVDSACQLVLRTWEVLDKCQYTGSGQVGIWSHVQTIKLNNTIAPTILSSQQDTVLSVYGVCKGEVALEIKAEDDCTPQKDLSYFYRIESTDDKAYLNTGHTKQFVDTLAIGSYRVYWIVEDKCGNRATSNYQLSVKDGKLPTPYCNASLSTALMNENGEVLLRAKAFNLASLDNCTAPEDLKFSFSKSVTDTTMLLDCSMIPNGISHVMELEMWVTDEAGNQDFCKVQVKVEDHFDACTNTGSIELAGKILTHGKGETLVDVPIRLISDQSEFPKLSNTDATGAFAFTDLPIGKDYQIQATKNDDPNNGVSTLDIILIQKHILGIQPFDNQFDMVAADVNRTGTINGSDIIHIRKLILGHYEHFPKTESWFFMNPNYKFLNPYTSSADAGYVIDAANSSKLDLQLLAIKMGDVNASYKADFSEDSDTRNERLFNMSWSADPRTNELVIYADQAMSCTGFQWAFSWKNAQLQDIQSDVFELSEEHYISSEEQIKMSYHLMESLDIAAGTVLFRLKFEDLSSLNNSFTLDRNIIRPEAYTAALEIRNPMLRKASEAANVSSFELLQNVPNPFKTTTVIPLDVLKTGTYSLYVHDANGVLVHQSTKVLATGRQVFDLDSMVDAPNGVYYYTIVGADEKQTKKFIKIR